MRDDDFFLLQHESNNLILDMQHNYGMVDIKFS